MSPAPHPVQPQGADRVAQYKARLTVSRDSRHGHAPPVAQCIGSAPTRRRTVGYPRTLAARRLSFPDDSLAAPPAWIHIAGRAAAGTDAREGEPHDRADPAGKPEFLFRARL